MIPYNDAVIRSLLVGSSQLRASLDSRATRAIDHLAANKPVRVGVLGHVVRRYIGSRESRLDICDAAHLRT